VEAVTESPPVVDEIGPPQPLIFPDAMHRASDRLTDCYQEDVSWRLGIAAFLGDDVNSSPLINITENLTIKEA
jgi:hypothetical protein